MEKILMAGAVAAVAVIILAPICIPILHRLKFGQSIRAEGPKSHQKKSGTPTMGGIFLIAGIFITTLIFAEWDAEIFLALFILFGHFILGFVDDKTASTIKAYSPDTNCLDKLLSLSSRLLLRVNY